MALLDGCRVVDLTDHRGLLAGRMLADLGADVVRVEPAGGSPARSAAPRHERGSYLWDTLAAGSRSVVADPAEEDGHRTLLALLGVADVLLESATPGHLAALGLDDETIRRTNPRLVHVSITAFGRTGPKAGWAESDLAIWAAGGPLDPHREDGRPPVRISVHQAFAHAAADAADGALFALIARARTGRGQHVDVSAQESVCTATLGRVLAAAVGDEDPSWDKPVTPSSPSARTDRSGSGSGTAPMLKKWACADGTIELHLAMGPAAGAFTTAFFGWMRDEGAPVGRFAELDWRRAAELVDAGDLTDADLGEAREIVSAFLAARTKAEVLTAARDRRLVAVPICDTGDAPRAEQALARGTFVPVHDGERTTLIQNGFATVGGAEAFRVGAPAPRPDEHRAAVLREWLGDEGVRTGSGPAAVAGVAG